MGLAACYGKGELEAGLLGYLDKISRVVAAIRSDHQVVRAKKLPFQQGLQAETTPHLLVRGKDEAHGELRLGAGCDERLERIERGDKGHPIVADPASIETGALDDGPIGVDRPERPIPLGNDIDMSQDAEPTPLLSRQLQEQRRPVPRRGPFVLDPLPCDGAQSQLRDKTLDLPGLLLYCRQEHNCKILNLCSLFRLIFNLPIGLFLMNGHSALPDA